MSPVPTRNIGGCSRYSNVSGGRLHYAAEHSKKRGLARPVGPEHGEQLTRPKLEAHLVDRAESPESTNESYSLQPEIQRRVLTRRRVASGRGH